MSENAEKYESINDELDARMDRIHYLERALEKEREENDLMKKALNRRADQATSRLRDTFQMIHKLAGGTNYDITDEQQIVVTVFERMLERTKMDPTWNSNDKENKFTKWTYIY